MGGGRALGECLWGGGGGAKYFFSGLKFPPSFGGFQVENPTKKATGLKGVLTAISLSEYGSEGFRVRLRRLSEYGSVAYLVERPTRETQAEQYSDTVLAKASSLVLFSFFCRAEQSFWCLL